MKIKEEKFRTVRGKLLRMRQALLRDSRTRIDQLLHDESKYQGISDDADLANMAFREGMDAANLNRDRSRLKAIEDALAKIDEGTYGICEDCEEQIPIARLNAMPFALRCIECQERHELLHAAYGEAVAAL